MSEPTKIDDGGPAYPNTVSALEWKFGDPKAFAGMSLRDYFAGMAMQGMLAHDDSPPNEADARLWANVAYTIADAMIAERKKANADNKRPT